MAKPATPATATRAPSATRRTELPEPRVRVSPPMSTTVPTDPYIDALALMVEAYRGRLPVSRTPYGRGSRLLRESHSDKTKAAPQIKKRGSHNHA